MRTSKHRRKFSQILQQTSLPAPILNEHPWPYMQRGIAQCHWYPSKESKGQSYTYMNTYVITVLPGKKWFRNRRYYVKSRDDLFVIHCNGDQETQNFEQSDFVTTGVAGHPVPTPTPISVSAINPSGKQDVARTSSAYTPPEHGAQKTRVKPHGKRTTLTTTQQASGSATPKGCNRNHAR